MRRGLRGGGLDCGQRRRGSARWLPGASVPRPALVPPVALSPRRAPGRRQRPPLCLVLPVLGGGGGMAGGPALGGRGLRWAVGWWLWDWRGDEWAPRPRRGAGSLLPRGPRASAPSWADLAALGRRRGAARPRLPRTRAGGSGVASAWSPGSFLAPSLASLRNPGSVKGRQCSSAPGRAAGPPLKAFNGERLPRPVSASPGPPRPFPSYAPARFCGVDLRHNCSPLLARGNAIRIPKKKGNRRGIGRTFLRFCLLWG